MLNPKIICIFTGEKYNCGECFSVWIVQSVSIIDIIYKCLFLKSPRDKRRIDRVKIESVIDKRKFMPRSCVILQSASHIR